MKVEVGKSYRVLENLNWCFEKDSIFYVKEKDYHSIQKEHFFKFTFTQGKRMGEECVEFDSTLSEMALQLVQYDERDEEPSKPAHYDTAIDTIDFMKANFSREAVEGFMRGNAIKYLQRNKGQKLSDLKKCRHYLDMLIELEEGDKG